MTSSQQTKKDVCVGHCGLATSTEKVSATTKKINKYTFLLYPSSALCLIQDLKCIYTFLYKECVFKLFLFFKYVPHGSFRVVSLYADISCYHVVSIPLCRNLDTRQHSGRLFHAIGGLEARVR